MKLNTIFASLLVMFVLSVAFLAGNDIRAGTAPSIQKAEKAVLVVNEQQVSDFSLRHACVANSPIRAVYREAVGLTPPTNSNERRAYQAPAVSMKASERARRINYSPPERSLQTINSGDLLELARESI